MFEYLEAIRRQALDEKVCYVGPFAGEFGHMLIHVLPFVSYLYLKGVNIYFCGFGNQEVFFQDETGWPITHKYTRMPTFSDTGVPDGNNLDRITNHEVASMCNEFIAQAVTSGAAFFDISNPFKYKEFFLWWLGSGYGKLFNLRKLFNPHNITRNLITFYSRTKVHTGVTGPEWDVDEVIKILAKHCEGILVAGHSDQSRAIRHPQVLNCVTSNNKEILTNMCVSKLIVSYNSGTAYIPRLFRIPGIVIHKGLYRGFQHTLDCSTPLSNSLLKRVTSCEELEEFLDELRDTK